MARRRRWRRPQKHVKCEPLGRSWSVGNLLLLLGWSSILPPAVAGARCGTQVSSAPTRSPPEPAAAGELPWVVSLRDLRGSHLAFGTILNEQWLLSTASSFQNRSQVLALVGDTDPKARRSPPLPISTIVLHEAFDELTLDHNIGLLRIAAPLQFDEMVRHVCFPYQNFPPAALEEDCWVIGWLEPHTGSSSLEKLSVVDVDPCPLHRIVTTECCSHREGDSVSGCLGYPGNPIVCPAEGTGQWVLKGVLTEGGARCYGPFLYTRVAYYSDWIVATTARWGPPASPIPLRRRFQALAEPRQGMFEPFLDEEARSASADLPGLNGTERLNSSGQGPVESRAKPVSIYYDYYGGESYPISAAMSGHRPGGLRGVVHAGLLLRCLAWCTTGQGAG